MRRNQRNIVSKCNQSTGIAISSIYSSVRLSWKRLLACIRVSVARPRKKEKNSFQFSFRRDSCLRLVSDAFKRINNQLGGALIKSYDTRGDTRGTGGVGHTGANFITQSSPAVKASQSSAANLITSLHVYRRCVHHGYTGAPSPFSSSVLCLVYVVVVLPLHIGKFHLLLVALYTIPHSVTASSKYCGAAQADLMPPLK